MGWQINWSIVNRNAPLKGLKETGQVLNWMKILDRVLTETSMGLSPQWPVWREMRGQGRTILWKEMYLKLSKQLTTRGHFEVVRPWELRPGSPARPGDNYMTRAYFGTWRQVGYFSFTQHTKPFFGHILRLLQLDQHLTSHTDIGHWMESIDIHTERSCNFTFLHRKAAQDPLEVN